MWFVLLEYETVNKTSSKVGIADFDIVAAILAVCVIDALPQNVRSCVNLRIDKNTAPPHPSRYFRKSQIGN